MKTYLTALALMLSVLIVSPAMGSSITSQTSDREHVAAGGGKGRVAINLTAPAGRCVNFESAKIDYTRRRYGQAQIVKLPATGCNPSKSQCQVEVDWEHAPAGRLTYRLEVKWTPANDC